MAGCDIECKGIVLKLLDTADLDFLLRFILSRLLFELGDIQENLSTPPPFTLQQIKI